MALYTLQAMVLHAVAGFILRPPSSNMVSLWALHVSSAGNVLIAFVLPRHLENPDPRLVHKRLHKHKGPAFGFQSSRQGRFQKP